MVTAARAFRIQLHQSRPARHTRGPRPRSTEHRRQFPGACPAVRMDNASTSAVDNQPMSTATGGQPLAPAVRMPIEDSFQVDMQGVRVHSDSRAQSAATGLSARAFTHAAISFSVPAKAQLTSRLCA